MKKILYVHDDQTNPSDRAGALEEAGFEVILQQDARRCLALVQRENPDLVVSDVLIHGMTGFQFLFEVRSLIPASKLPFILCSGIYRGAAYQEEASRLGADEYLMHPFAPQDLVRAVRKVLDPGDSTQAA